MKKNVNVKGKEYWRSLDQLAETPEFQEFLHREFPENVSEMISPVSRRKFLTLMGASIAFAGLAGCRRPVEKIVPYVIAPENIVPGIPMHYATTMPFGLDSYGLVVENHEGRPTKIEGNKKHPSSLGSSNAFIQSEMLNLYDPDRSQSVRLKGVEKDWTEFVTFWREIYPAFLESGGEGLAVVSGAFSSPSLYRMFEKFNKEFPKADWSVYEPVSDENIYSGIKIASGKTVRPVYHFDKAKVILSLDADFLLMENESIKANKGFAAGRRVESEKDNMNRLYVAESVFTVTGGMADHRLRLESSMIPAFIMAVAEELSRLGLPIDLPFVDIKDTHRKFDRKWINELAKDLLKNDRQSLIVAGRRQPAIVHSIIYALNHAMGNAGNTVTYHELKDLLIPSLESFKRVADKVNAGDIDTLIILGGNPVFDAPSDFDFKSLLKKVKHSVHLSMHVDETSEMTEWHIPQAHFLESWGDARAADGSRSVIQPMIEPLFGGHTMIELLNVIISGEDRRGYDIVRETWQNIFSAAEYEKKWRGLLHNGVADADAGKDINPGLNSSSLHTTIKKFKFNHSDASVDNLEVVFMASPAVYDGRYANNGWMQEMPDPVTKITWDNAALMSQKTADELGVKTQDLVRLTYKDRDIIIPVSVLPGQADYSIALPVGYGRRSVGRIGNGTGFDVYQIRTSDALNFDQGAKITGTGETYLLANSQDHNSMEGRPLVREASLDHYRQHPDFAPKMVESPPLKSLWEDRVYDEGYQWGMTIDLNACSGCNACVIACQSENNIPIVGKEQVSKGREMHWIRLDRYFAGDIDNPEMVYQPVACQHCENAPCEQVCPVQATVHDDEGLNVMTYNRCIGTRYCSNNCPYKVRRFNFFNYTKDLSEIIKMAQNPDVTVRSRGVMEKCTFCIQRISGAKNNAKLEEREVLDGEIETACQQSCPADAIVFGNINDPESAVSKMKKQNRNYTMLGELNVKTRTTFLAKLRNPNPELENYKINIS